MSEDDGGLLGILSLASGVLGLLILPIVFGPAAIYLGMKAREKDGPEGQISGLLGMVLGAIEILIILFVLLAVLVG